MKIKLRKATKIFMEPSRDRRIMKKSFCIEAREVSQWTLLGDENGIYKFETAEERDAKLAELVKEIDESERVK